MQDMNIIGKCKAEHVVERIKYCTMEPSYSSMELNLPQENRMERQYS